MSQSLFDSQLLARDLSLYDHIESETTADDRRTLLTVQLACRDRAGPFTYLEIGSHLGGSLQPYLIDPQCKCVISIDARPSVQADQRGFRAQYPGNSTARMLDSLARVPGADLGKVVTFETSTATLSPADLPHSPCLSLIDGEHTDEAALRDARFVRAATAERGGLILFHDARVIYGALATFTEELQAAGVPFRAFVFPDCIFAIELGGLGIGESPWITELAALGWKAYLFSLLANDHYRRTVKHPVVVALMRVNTAIRSLMKTR